MAAVFPQEELAAARKRNREEASLSTINTMNERVDTRTAADRTLRYSCDMRTTNATTSVVTLSSWQQMLISALPLSSQQMKKTPRHSVGRTRRRFRHYTKKKCMQAGLHKNENFQDRRPWYQRGMRNGIRLIAAEKHLQQEQQCQQ